MPKTKISEFSATPANNTDIDSINIAEGCAPSGINDAIRELMSQLKDFQTGAVGDSFNGPVNGTLGATTPATASVTTLAASGAVTLSGGTANGVTYLNGSKVLTSGSALTFDGTNISTSGLYVSSATTGRLSKSASTGRNVLTGGVTGGITDGAYVITEGYDYGGTGLGGQIQLVTAGASSPITFAVNGTEGMRLTSTGLGIGTSSPASKLDISGGGTTAKFNTLDTYDGGASLSAWMKVGRRAGTGANAYINTLHSGSDAVSALTFAFGTTGTGTEVMRLLSDGSLVLNNAGGDANMYFGGSSGTNRMYLARSGVNSLLVNVETSGALIFGTNGSERARITSGGQVLVGSTTTVVNAGTTQLYVKTTGGDYAGYFETTNTSPYGTYIKYSGAAPNSTGFEFLVCSDTSATRIQLRSNGGFGNYSGNNVNLSDRREKTNFAPAKSYLDVICAIPVQTFNYIDQNMEEDGGLTLGVVAQDVQAVAPELVTESNWGTEEAPKMRLSIYQTDLQYALMKALQELKADFDAYKASHP